MFLPLLIIVVAAASAAVVAYGAHPAWVQYAHGLDLILWSRRLQWPLVALSILACIALIGLAISGRRRAWWMLGLAPVLALLAHRFTIGPAAAGRMAVVDAPSFVAAGDAKLAPDDWVVGLSFGGATYAYPYAALFATPVVIQSDHDKRIMLMWSAYANRVLVVPISRDIKARELEVVSTPANALLLYDGRRGQFINGVTGLTMKRERPAGFAAGTPLPAWKMPWKEWRALHPDAQVMAWAPPAAGVAASGMAAPTRPILPAWPLPSTLKLDRPADTRVAVAGAAQPVAVESDQLTAAPLNVHADGVPVLLFRETSDGPVRAFDRRTFDGKGKLDLILQLVPNFSPRKHPGAFLIDANSNSGWDANGVCVDAPKDAKQLKGDRLERVAVDDGLYWGVMKYWYPDLQREIPPAAPISVEPDHDAGEAAKPANRRNTKRGKPAAAPTRAR